MQRIVTLPNSKKQKFCTFANYRFITYYNNIQVHVKCHAQHTRHP
ncbi:hypothetical protein M23134_07728 [Microscilla marina ATCC 23134]|uniref:Uncharacterized protein n=1 Tax=Microscilla marina ATCC 23134 TaxID=313606 RepID=A1ZYE4_MICM2|nr:hypothetical protein M23134_07728 [Microscilla marina ATCC 23134]